MLFILHRLCYGEQERQGVSGRERGTYITNGGGGVPTAILGVAEHLRRIKPIHNSALATK